MSYKVSTADLNTIRLNETDTVSAVLQNIAIILATRQGSVPLYREFGLTQEFVDKPLPVAKTLLFSEIREAIERFEPRASVIGITFETPKGSPGVLIPIVEVNIIE